MKLSPKAQASINKVIEKFKTGDLSPISEVVRINLDKSAPAHNWSLSNQVLAFMQSEELDCRGFRQWQKVDRQIKKGSRAVYILRPHTIKQDSDTKEKDKTLCIGFSPVAVFPASTTTGESNISSYEPVEFPPLYDIAKSLISLLSMYQ